MSVMLESYKAVAVSTGHLCGMGLTNLNIWANDSENNMVMLRKTGYVMKLYGNENDLMDDDIPESLKAIITLAHEQKARIIEIDRDVDVVDGLPIYPLNESFSATSVRSTCELMDVYDECDERVRAEIVASSQGISIHLGDHDSLTGSEPILVEFNGNEVMVHVWADSEIEEPTDSISLLKLRQ